ncbi:sugar ABC transporter permease [Ruania alkalisoli]|uniref:Sugar ABC transporter permease n=1 Tax=Ruania alkalisoli TaxID=2779775 RepID=A0A7M1SUZ6_9MICO|nr:sugar ABC transporter permease [Ruania alkalisoli]QOR70562.1 sugar ABC transporter permease [Ruania alkalisoli]
MDRHFAVLLVAPGMLWMLALLLYPVLLNFYYSFTNKSFQYPNTSFVGLDNYSAFLSDPAFWSSLGNSAIWTVTSVIGQLVIGFVAALTVEAIARGRALVRLLLIVPWMFSSIVLASTWRLMLDGLTGVANAVIIGVGVLEEPVAFFGDGGTALASVIVMNVWFGAPFMFLAFLAGMQTVPQDLYEAAVTDGAGYWRQVWHVTLPALRPIVGTLVILRTIWVLNNFDFIYLTTGGGPRDTTMTLPLYAFRAGWAQFEVGRMAAISVGMMLALLALVIVLFRLMPIDSDEDGS